MSRKPHTISAKDRTSQAIRVSALKRTTHLASLVRSERPDFHERRADVWEFLTSDDVIHGMVNMTRMDRRITLIAVTDTTRPFADKKLIPPRARSYAERCKWDAAAIATLRAIAKKHGVKPGLDREIARRMGRPLHAVTIARARYVGRVRAPQVHRKKGYRGPRTVGKVSRGVARGPVENTC